MPHSSYMPRSIDEALKLSQQSSTATLSPEQLEQIYRSPIAAEGGWSVAPQEPVPDVSGPQQSWVARAGLPQEIADPYTIARYIQSGGGEARLEQQSLRSAPVPHAGEEAVQEPALGLGYPGVNAIPGKIGALLASKGAVAGAAAAGIIPGIVRRGLNASEGVTVSRLSPYATSQHPIKATHILSTNENFFPEMEGRYSGATFYLNTTTKNAYLQMIKTSRPYQYQGVGDEAMLAALTKMDEMGIKSLDLKALPDAKDFYIKMGGKPDSFGNFDDLVEFTLPVKETRKLLEGKKLTEKYPNPMRSPRSEEELRAIEKARKLKVKKGK